MDYDYRNRGNSTYRPGSSGSSTYPMYGQGSYPQVGISNAQSQTDPLVSQFGGGSHQPSFHHTSTPSFSSTGLGIRVVLKPEYKITQLPQLSPVMGHFPRSNVQLNFDFEFEKRVLAEAEKEHPNWSQLFEDYTKQMSRPTDPSSLQHASPVDPLVNKYIASGFDREAVHFAVPNYGDNPAKVKEFANAFATLREMGFPANKVAEGLLMFDNDPEKALTHFLSSG